MNKPVSLSRFMELALYDPAAGYYTTRRPRVGRSPGTDFYTASSLAAFPELVLGAVASFVPRGEWRNWHLVEIGTEPVGGIFGRDPAEPASGFRSLHEIGPGGALAWPEPAVVFSNELFDAQAVHRIVMRQGCWREQGVMMAAPGAGLSFCDLPEWTQEVAAMVDRLPSSAREGCCMDLPLGACALLERIASRPWKGVFIAFDYGKTWRSLCCDAPAGTLRAYSGHRQTPDILEKPGEQDLTAHVCWDWMEEVLGGNGFRQVELVSQEAFFVRRAAETIRTLLDGGGGALSGRHREIQSLLHPALFGQQFQVLSAVRP